MTIAENTVLPAFHEVTAAAVLAAMGERPQAAPTRLYDDQELFTALEVHCRLWSLSVGNEDNKKADKAGDAWDAYLDLLSVTVGLTPIMIYKPRRRWLRSTHNALMDMGLCRASAHAVDVYTYAANGLRPEADYYAALDALDTLLCRIKAGMTPKAA